MVNRTERVSFSTQKKVCGRKEYGMKVKGLDGLTNNQISPYFIDNMSYFNN